MRNRMAVISFKSEAVTDMVKRMTPRLTWMSFNSRARDTQALYMMEPMITAVVDFTNPKRLNSWVPMMTLANPMTMVPVPMEISKNPFCWQYTLPARAAKPLAMARPTIFTMPLSLAREVTSTSLSPTARRR